MAKLVKYLKGEPLLHVDSTLYYKGLYEGVMQPPQADKITFLNPEGHKVVFKGSFTIDNGMVTGGTVTGFDVYLGSLKVMKAKGFSIAHAELMSAIDSIKTSSGHEPFKDLFFAGAKIKGYDNDDFITAHAGSKVLGLGGDDFLRAEPGQSKVVLKGGDGDDVLVAHGGSKLFGGKGDDIFVYGDLGQSSNDFYADFNVKEDVVAIYPGVIPGVPVGPLADNYFHVGKKAKDADDYVIYDRKSGNLYVDLDGSGNGAQMQIARLPEKLKMTADNIMIADFL